MAKNKDNLLGCNSQNGAVPDTPIPTPAPGYTFSAPPASDETAEELLPVVVPQETAPVPSPSTPVPPKKTASMRRKRRKRIKLIVGLVIAAACIMGVVLGFRWLFGQGQENIDYMYEAIRRDSIELSVSGWGNIVPIESSDVAVLSKGTVIESHFEPGEMVEEGALLFKLDSEDLDAEVQTLQEKIDKATKDLTAIQGDETELLSNLTLKAPFAGKLIEAEPHKVGDTVSVGTKVGKLVDDSTMILSLYFSYAYENDIKTGMVADISVPATMSSIPGAVQKINMVRRVSPEGTKLFEVIFAVKNPGALTADMDASAVIHIGNEDVLPAETGKLAYARTQDLVFNAPGKLTFVDLVNYLDYKSGAVLGRIEYKSDNTQVEALKKTIQDYETEMVEKKKGYDALSVTAPMSGTLMYNKAVVGEVLQPGLAVVSIANLDKMKVEARIDERDISRISPDMPVEITIWMQDGQQILPGVVSSVSITAQVDQGMGQSYFPAIFEIQNTGGQLLSGMGVDYRIVVDSKADILVAPVLAVKNTEQGTCVFLQTETKPDNALDLGDDITLPPGTFAVPVECGIGNETGIEILSGVNEGDMVFTMITKLDEPADPYGGGGMVKYG